MVEKQKLDYIRPLRAPDVVLLQYYNYRLSGEKSQRAPQLKVNIASLATYNIRNDNSS